MPLLPRLLSLRRTLRGAAAADGDLDEELRAHVEMLTQEKIAAGVDPAAACREALIETGGIEQVKERVREVRAGAFLSSVLQDVRYGARTLARTPGFTAAAILALALGIGASTAIFSVVDAVLLRPLPYRDPDSLAVVLHRGRNPVSAPNFRDWQKESLSFQAMGAAEGWQPNLIGGERPERVEAVRMTSEILPFLGVRPLIGRVFAAEEQEPGKEHEVVLSHAIWQRRFGANRRIVGETINLDGEPYTVIGVMPPAFRFPPFWQRGAQLWAPLSLASRAASRDGNSLRVFARLKPDVSLRGAQAEISAVTARLEKQFPGTNREVSVRSLQETVVGRVRPALFVLLAAVGFLLLIACGNVAHMLLARAAARQKEVAVRTAIGASRGRLVRQFLTESLILALTGGGAGLLLALAATRVIVAIRPLGIPGIESLAIDGRVLAFSLAVSIATGVAFGLVPALQSSRRDLSHSLREGERGSTEGRGKSRLRSLLVGSEFALALVLLIAAGLMARTFLALQAVDPGFDPRHVLSMVVSVSGSPSAEPGRRAVFYPRVAERVRGLPGVRSASFINHLPLAGDIWGFPFAIEGRPAPARGDTPTAAYRVVLPGYFATMRLPLLRGRDVSDSDRLGATGVIIVNEWLANRYWPGENPVGKRMTLGPGSAEPEWLTVIGVAKNAARSDWAAPAEAEVYVPWLQTRRYLEGRFFAVEYMTLLVATSGDPAAAAGPLRSAIQSVDPSVTVSEVQTMEHAVGEANAQPRFYLLLLATFAGAALILAAVGIYGVMSYVVSTRTHEMGIRMALGARRGHLLRLVVRQGMLVALMGAAAGVAGALALTRLMAGLLYKVPPTDFATFASVTGVLTAVALAATWIPARRATRIDPMTALRGS
ncbi:MAG: ABC transporter permease [Acidobacteriota bacterium]